MRTSALPLILLIPLLAGCGPSPFPVLASKLDAMKGKPIKVAMDVLGAPRQVSQVGDETSYLWSLTKEFGTAYNFVAPQCDITVFTGKDGKITHYAYDGTGSACSEYAKKFDSNY